MRKKDVFSLVIVILCSMGFLWGCGADRVSDEPQAVQNEFSENVEQKATQEESKEETKTTEKTDIIEAQKDEAEEKTTDILKMANSLYDSYYPVYLFVDYEENLFLNKSKELKIFVDGEELEKVEQGAETCYAMILSKGEHTLKVSTSFIDADSQNFFVDKDAYMDDIPNFIYCDLAFIDGNAEISSLFRLDDVEFEDNIETLKYYTLSVDKAQKQYKAIGDFEKVMKQHEAME